MDSLLPLAATGLGGLALFVVAIFWRRLEAAEARLTDFRVEVAGQYVRATALDSFRREILDHLERIERKVDAQMSRAP